MGITDQDIRLMASEVLSDADDAGGRITGSEIIDGVSNNLFPDISELDRTIGRVNLRKVYPSVLSNNRDTYYGANVIIDQAPIDPRVSVTLFTTKSWTDQRKDAVSRMESYLTRGPKYDGYLWDQHIAGQKAILIIQRPDRELPPVGGTLVLVKDPGLSTEQQQFVRITKVSAQERTFSASGCQGDFKRTVVTCEISDPLLFDIIGGIPHCQDDVGERYYNGQPQNTARSKIYTTVVADAAKYAGITHLAEPARMGDFTVRAQSIFTSLVPSAQVETPITDAKPHGDSSIPVAAGDALTITTSATWSPTAALYIGGGIYPGSLAITTGGITITDRAGKLMANGTEIGTVDYSNGILRVNTGGASYPGNKTITYKHAAFPVRNMQTAAWDITAESRSGTIVFMLDPVAAPWSLSIHYMAQGKWYVLRDTGSGELRGSDTAYGSGMINYATGSVIVTLGALPDVGSSVIAVWGTALVDNIRAGHAVKAMMRMDNIDTGLDAHGKPNAIARGALTIQWVGNDGSTKTSTDNGRGALTGDATGRVHYTERWVEFYPNELPPAGTEIRVITGFAETSTAISSRSSNSITLANTPKPGTVKIFFDISPSDRIEAARAAIDDGNGNLIAMLYGMTTCPSGNGQKIGSINYETRECVIDRPINGSTQVMCGRHQLLGTVKV